MSNTEAPDDSVPVEEAARGLVVLRHVRTFVANGQIPAREWKYADQQQRQAFANHIRTNCLSVLEAQYPDHFYDFVEFTVTEPAHDGSSLIMSADRTLQSVAKARCVAMVYAPAFLEPSPTEREAFLRWAAQADIGETGTAVVERLADLWAQGTRPVVAVEGSIPS